jgi:hypothetical protein
MGSPGFLDEMKIRGAQSGIAPGVQNHRVEPFIGVAEVGRRRALLCNVAEPERFKDERADGAAPEHMRRIPVMVQQLGGLGEKLQQSEPRAEAAEGMGR